MDLSEFGSITCGKVKMEELPEEQLENNSISSPNRQNSIFLISLEENQDKSEKSFESMNIDELLNSTPWSAERNQASPNINQNVPENVENVIPQGSFSVPVPTLLHDKTLEEVWIEMNRNQSQKYNINNNGIHEKGKHQETYGDMTLEDYLIKSGVVRDSSAFSSQKRMWEIFENNGGNLMSNNARLDANVGSGNVMVSEFSTHSNLGENNVVESGTSSMYETCKENGGILGEPTNNVGNEKCDGSFDNSEPSSIRRRERSPSMEVAVERRQRRMIKNRESAARSRARKQAYTIELEIELNQLKEQNEKLKFILAEANHNRKQKVKEEKQPTRTQRIAQKLRRTSSLWW